MNAVVQRESQLKSRNYVRKARPKANYWVDFSALEMDKYRQATGDEFCLIIHGSPDVESDFFVIPYEALKHVLIDDNLDKRRDRWIGSIKNNKLKIGHSRTDVTPYYGDLGLLELAGDGFRGAVDLAPEEGDTPDEVGEKRSPYTSEGGDWRHVVTRQIKARRGQQKFRNALRNRYGDQCLISGCRLMDIVEAAHIKPYRGEPDNQPANGLLLRADLHTLFDLDLLGIEPGTLIVRVHPSAQVSGYEAFDDGRLKCDRAQPDEKVLAIRWRAYQRRRSQVTKVLLKP